MKRRGMNGAALAAGALALVSSPAWATDIVITIDAGSQTASFEAACLGVVQAFTNNDCSYNQANPTYPSPPMPWIGPNANGPFYPLNGAPATPPGDFVNFPDPATDGRQGIPLSGTLTIDDMNAPAACATHQISGTIVMAPFDRNYQTQVNLRFVDHYPQGITQAIAKQPFNAGAPNVLGGCDYVLGSAGVPQLIVASPTAPSYPNEIFPGSVPHSAALPAKFTNWAGPEPSGIGLVSEEGNAGIASTATVGDGPADGTADDFSCVASDGMGGTMPCDPNPYVTWNTTATASWMNIVGRIRTNGAGDIVDSLLFVTHDEPAVGFPGYGAYTVTLTGSGPPGGETLTAVDDSVRTLPGQAITIPILANDTGFIGSVITVAPAGGPASGTAVVNGSPGDKAGISITYTPNGGFSGTDTFDYTVDDGVGSDTGTVTVAVNDAVPVANAGAITIGTQGVSPETRTGSVDVAGIAGNNLGDAPRTVTTGNFSRGSATLSGTTITYTPDAAFYAGPATFDYTITDVDGQSDTGQVTVTIPDLAPALNDRAATGEQDAEIIASASFTAGNGDVAGDHTLAVQADATNGECVAAIGGGNVIVTYTPDSGYAGTDSCVVRLTDGDGDFDDGTFTFTVEGEETGVFNLPGGSALDPWTLALLASGLAALRRRRVA